MDKAMALGVVISCLKEALEQLDSPIHEVTEDTVIVGPSAVLDSISVVSLIVDVEQHLEMDHGISITLASEKAMSQKSSPFRTAGVLAEHVCATIMEGEAA